MQLAFHPSFTELYKGCFILQNIELLKTTWEPLVCQGVDAATDVDNIKNRGDGLAHLHGPY